MKNLRLGIILTIIATLCLSGCGSGKPKVNPAFVPENDIVTYEVIDPEKTQLVVSTMGDGSVVAFSRAFEKANPDVQIICVDITGGVTDVRPVVDWVERGLAPDIMFNVFKHFEDDETVKYMVNLSDNSLTTLFESQTMNRMAIDGNVYGLPGPSSLCCMIYNKTLFDKYGWKVPVTFDEFVELCVKIRTDTNGEIEPWNPNAKYSNEILTVTEGFTYAELFGGLENRTWLNEFMAEEANFSSHMGPYYDMLETLIDNGILREEHFSYSATARGKEFAAGKIAMINNNIQDYDNDEFDFGYMPFPCTIGEVGYVAQTDNKVLNIPKKEHTDKEQDAIDRFIKYFASVEGQRAFIGDSLMVSNLEGVKANQSTDLEALQTALDMGHRFTRINFSADKKPNISVSDDAIALIKGERTKAECMAKVDANPFSPYEKTDTDAQQLAVAGEDFSLLETSFYLADAYREKAASDIALINHLVAFRGNLMRIFEGPLNKNNVVTLKPRSFGNEATLVRLKMTGRQILDALNAPHGSNGPTNSVYAYSGLKCEIAPWNELGKKYVSVKLADGSALDENKLYTVAAWAGTVSDEFVTEVDATFDGTFEDILSEKLLRDKIIKPAKDSRCKLIWE